jgi:hypothetical protein
MELVLFPDGSSASRATHECNVPECYPDLQFVLRKFVYLTVTTASYEMHFSNLTTIIYYQRASMGQEIFING